MIKEIRISEIKPNPNQPRKHFDEGALHELAESIKADGLQAPILVRPKDGGYEIVQGERRYRAHEIAGLETISAEVKEISDDDAFHLAVIENIQREQLSPIEEAQAFYRYVEMGYTHEQIAEKVSKSRTFVTTRLRLLNLSQDIQDWIAEGRLSEGHAKVLLTAKKDLCRLIETCKALHGDLSPFEFVQEKFIKDHQDYQKISVRDVSEWLDIFKYLVVSSELNWIRFLSEPEKIRELEAVRSFGVFNVTMALKLGADYSKFERKDIEFAFEFMRRENDGRHKNWKIVKAEEEWLELYDRVPFTQCIMEDIIEIVKEKDLYESFLVY